MSTIFCENIENKYPVNMQVSPNNKYAINIKYKYAENMLLQNNKCAINL